MTTTGRNKFNLRPFLAAFIGVLGIIGAPREQVWADELVFAETVTGTDLAVAAVGGLRNTRMAALRVRGISGPVNKAYLYWHGPVNSDAPQTHATIRLNGQPFTGVNIGSSSDNHWGYKRSQAYRADVTRLIRARRNGTYLLSHYVQQGTNINANGASLLVFFDDGNPANNRDIILFEGNDSNADNAYDAPGWNAILWGVNCPFGRGFLQLHVADGQFYEDAALVLNGAVIDHRGEIFQGLTVPAANRGPVNTGRLWDVVTYDATELFTAGTNDLVLTHGYLGRNHRSRGDSVSLVLAVINLPEGAVPANGSPVITGTPAMTVHSPNPIAIQAFVTDADGDAITYSVAIDGVMVANDLIPAGSPTTSALVGVTNSFGLGRHSVVFTVNDGRHSGSFTTVVSVIDTVVPTLAVPASITVPSDLGRTNAVVHFIDRITVADEFPGLAVVALPPSGSAFRIGTTTVSVTAVDASGNRTQASFPITVTDSFPPTIDQPKDLLRPADPGTSNAVVNFTVNARDNLPGVTVACEPSSGSVFRPGITTVVCSARDAAGNTATAMFTVTVVDR